MLVLGGARGQAEQGGDVHVDGRIVAGVIAPDGQRPVEPGLLNDQAERVGAARRFGLDDLEPRRSGGLGAKQQRQQQAPKRREPRPHRAPTTQAILHRHGPPGLCRKRVFLYRTDHISRREQGSTFASPKKPTMLQVPKSLIHGARIGMQTYVLIAPTLPPKHRHIPMCRASAKPVMIRATVSMASMVIWIVNCLVQSSEFWPDPVSTGRFLGLA